MEQTTQKNKEVLKLVLGIAIGFLTVIALAFTHCYAEKYSYYSRYSYEWKDNGFNFLIFNSELLSDKFMAATVFIALICWGMLIVGIGCIAVAVMNFLNRDKDTLSKRLIIACVALTFLYALSGVIVTLVSAIAFGTNAVTYAFIPLILMIPLVVLYFMNAAKPVNVQAGENGGVNTGEQYIDIVKHLLLSIFTFGIWTFIWIYKTTTYLNRAKRMPKSNPTSQLLLCLFIPFYSIYWVYEQGKKLDEIKKDMGDMYTPNATSYLIMAIFASMAVHLFMQVDINHISAPKAEIPEEDKELAC